MCVHEEGYLAQVVILIDDLCQIHHCFAAFVQRYRELRRSIVDDIDARGQTGFVLKLCLYPGSILYCSRCDYYTSRGRQIRVSCCGHIPGPSWKKNRESGYGDMNS